MKRFMELVRRLEEVQGVPFDEVSQVVAVPVPADPNRDKGYAGRLVEAVLEKLPDSRSQPDLESFDTEVKTIPIDIRPTALEPTKVTALNPKTLLTEQWEFSEAYRKLRVVLFVPVVKHDLKSPSHWYVRGPFIWIPSRDHLAQLQADWEAIRKVVRAGGVLSSAKTSPGKFLMTKTSYQGGKGSTKRYAFWLRREFVTQLLLENIHYSVLRT